MHDDLVMLALLSGPLFLLACRRVQGSCVIQHFAHNFINTPSTPPETGKRANSQTFQLETNNP